MSRAFLPPIIVLLTPSAVLHAQAMAEYALGAARSTGAGAVGNRSIGGCRIDGDLFLCLNRNHPTATLAVIVVVSLLILYRLAFGSRRRTY